MSSQRLESNKSTFRLLDPHFPKYDPFFYVSPFHHSLSTQVYNNGELVDKLVAEGFNDQVGDYKMEYDFASPLNDKIIKNVGQSKLLAVIIPLLTEYLKAKLEQSSEPFMGKLVDAGIFHRCLKLLIIILKSFKTTRPHRYVLESINNSEFLRLARQYT